MSEGVRELEDAIGSLEAALAVHREQRVEQERRMAALRAEIDHLHGVQSTVAGRLDEMIARLHALIGD